MHSTYQINANLITGTLANMAKSVNKPRFLRDVLAIKKDRGDEDCAYFELNARYYANRLNSTVEGAHYTASRAPSMKRFAGMLEEFL